VELVEILEELTAEILLLRTQLADYSLLMAGVLEQMDLQLTLLEAVGVGSLLEELA
jgi:hypothetical protein